MPNSPRRESTIKPKRTVTLTNESDNSKAIETEWKAVVEDVSALTVNCTASKTLCHELDVVSFPTIRAYKGLDDVRRYRGPRVSRE